MPAADCPKLRLGKTAGGVEGAADDGAAHVQRLALALRKGASCQPHGGKGKFLLIERAQVAGEPANFFELSSRFAHGLANPTKAIKPGFLHCVGLPREICRRRSGHGDRELELIVSGQGPRLDPSLAKVAREFLRESVKGEHAIGTHDFDIAEQIIVIRMI